MIQHGDVYVLEHIHVGEEGSLILLKENHGALGTRATVNSPTSRVSQACGDAKERTLTAPARPNQGYHLVRRNIEAHPRDDVHRPTWRLKHFGDVDQFNHRGVGRNWFRAVHGT